MLIKPDCGLISVNFSYFLTKISKSDPNTPANLSWVSALTSVTRLSMQRMRLLAAARLKLELNTFALQGG